MSLPIEIYQLGMQDYQTTWDAMQAFTKSRTADSNDRLYLVQHPPVFTQGQAGKAEHVLNPGNIPVIQSDRGGQVTYHGPGQLVLYVMLDLKRANFTIRQLVSSLEQSIVSLLSTLGITADTRCDAPGVYVNNAKIASIGLRVKRGCSYHGLALNVDMDLEPFTRINPCGYAHLAMTQISDHVSVDLKNIENLLLSKVTQTLNYVNIDTF